MTQAIETCVHCGFCLPACPTYSELGQEADSPRGRIVLMKEVLERRIPAEAVQQQIDQCLGCLACETACPSGVSYRNLVSPYRATEKPKRKFLDRFRDWIVSRTLPYPARFRWALRIAQWTRWLHWLTPAPLKPMTQLVPESIPKPVKLDSQYPAVGTEKTVVSLLAGCAQQVLAPQINLATIRLLTECGARVLVPPNQSCCGALAWHNGDANQARELAEKNLQQFSNQSAWIVTNAAGCGSGMREYDVVFEGTDQQQAASELAKRARDVSELLVELGLADKLKRIDSGTGRIRVAYHDACHLSNGQNVRAQPRTLIASIPGVELVEIPDSGFCCGSAGTYNIEQPSIARSLGHAKAKSIVESGADLLVTGNIGCIVQVQNHLKAIGSKVRVQHLVEFLADQLQLKI